MQNVNLKLDGNMLTITVDISKRLAPSSSGKTIIVASTAGNKSVGAVKVGLNVFAPIGS